MNPNESVYSGATSKKSYYSVDGEGRLFRKATELEIALQGVSLVAHVKTKGVNAGDTVYRTLVNFLKGFISAIYLKSSKDVGDSLVVELYENGYYQVLEVAFSSDFSNDILRKLPNLRPGILYNFQSWKMQAKTAEGKPIAEKFYRGVSIKDGDVKIEKYVTKDIQQQLVPKESIGIYDPNSESQSSDYWDVYFKTLSFIFKTRLLPKYQKHFEDWASENIKEVQQLSAGNNTSALPQGQTFTADRPQYEPEGATTTKLDVKDGDDSWIDPSSPAADFPDDLPF
jgi:hypothetical protein